MKLLLAASGLLGFVLVGSGVLAVALGQPTGGICANAVVPGGGNTAATDAVPGSGAASQSGDSWVATAYGPPWGGIQGNGVTASGLDLRAGQPAYVVAVEWITVYANPTHAWIVIAGIALDTAEYGGASIPAGSGPRWRSDATANLTDGSTYVVRHPAGV
jgi:hypothetical protein